MLLSLDRRRKILFFLFIYALAITPIGYMISAYFLDWKNIIPRFFLNRVGLEHVALVATVFLILSKDINVKKYLNFGTTCTLGLFIWVFLIIIVSYFDVGIVEFGWYLNYFDSIICWGFLFLLLGLNINLINGLFQIKKFRVIFYVVTGIFSCFIVLSAILNPLSSIYPWYLVGITKCIGLDREFDYLYVSDTFALLLLFMLSHQKSINCKLIIILLGAFLISLIGSRTSFTFFILSASLVLIIKFFSIAGHKKMLFLIVLFLLSGYIISTIMTFSELPVSFAESHRFNISRFLDGTAFEGRLYWLEVGLSEIGEHWFLGRYLSEVVQGTPGTYIHNWLSFWSAFGLGPFLLSIFIMIFVMHKITVLFIHDINSPIKEFLFMCSIFMIMSIITSRNYAYCYIWFILSAIPMIRPQSFHPGSFRQEGGRSQYNVKRTELLG